MAGDWEPGRLELWVETPPGLEVGAITDELAVVGDTVRVPVAEPEPGLAEEGDWVDVPLAVADVGAWPGELGETGVLEGVTLGVAEPELVLVPDVEAWPGGLGEAGEVGALGAAPLDVAEPEVVGELVDGLEACSLGVTDPGVVGGLADGLDACPLGVMDPAVVGGLTVDEVSAGGVAVPVEGVFEPGPALAVEEVPLLIAGCEEEDAPDEGFALVATVEVDVVVVTEPMTGLTLWLELAPEVEGPVEEAGSLDGDVAEEPPVACEVDGELGEFKACDVVLGPLGVPVVGDAGLLVWAVVGEALPLADEGDWVPLSEVPEGLVEGEASELDEPRCVAEVWDEVWVVAPDIADVAGEAVLEVSAVVGWAVLENVSVPG